MKQSFRLPVILLLLVAFLLTSDPPARAGIPTGTQIVLIFVAVGAVGAAIGVGVYYAVRKSPSVSGCAVSSSSGLMLQNESDRQTLLLLGDTAAIKSGDRVRLKGKKKRNASGAQTFLVDKLTKDYGMCRAVPATP